ncbi:MAG: hypothetical protein ACT4NV_02355 [Rhodoferax sp.]
MSVPLLKLQEAWRQCQRHRHYLQYSLSALEPLLPLTGAALAQLSDETVQDLDQFIYRFSKLQDAMGTGLFPALLGHLQEPYEDRPMVDRLHRLEQLGFLPDSEQWQTLRVLRNRLTHDYPDDDQLKAASLNEAVAQALVLFDVLARIEPALAASH